LSGEVRVRVEIDHDALRRNLARARGVLPRECSILGVVKANAYGHGAVEVSRTLEAEGIAMLGVGDAGEGAALRRAGIGLPILVLGASLEGELPTLIAEGIIPSLDSLESIESMARAAARAGVRLPVHLLVDSGMGRLGVPAASAPAALRRVRATPSLRLAGLATHLSSPDQEAFTREQLARFRSVVDAAIASGDRPPSIHVASTGAFDRHPEAWFDGVRLGGYLYGFRKSGGGHGEAPSPVLSLHAPVCHLRDHAAGTPIGYGGAWVAPRASRIATLPIGYHDGIPYSLGGRGEVLLRGRRAPIIGRVTMDYVMVDATEVPEVRVGDRATLIGAQEGESISIGEVADRAGTIPYEICCRLGPRAVRVHRGAARGGDAPTPAEAARGALPEPPSGDMPAGHPARRGSLLPTPDAGSGSS